MMIRSVATVLCAVFLIGAAGCAGWFGKEEEKTAAELAKEGEAYFEDEKYSKALEAYERVRDWYPYSTHTKKAELRVADAYYKMKNYEQARVAYEHYENMHPGDPEIPYVIYRRGMCHYERIKSIDRTPVPTQKALEAFNRLQSRFPESEYAKKAEPKINDCRQRLAGHEFYVGRFYFKAGRYEAALHRFESVVEKYPDIDKYRGKAEDYIESSKNHLAEMDKEEERHDDPVRRPAESRDTGFDEVPRMPQQ